MCCLNISLKRRRTLFLKTALPKRLGVITTMPGLPFSFTLKTISNNGVFFLKPLFKSSFINFLSRILHSLGKLNCWRFRLYLLHVLFRNRYCELFSTFSTTTIYYLSSIFSCHSSTKPVFVKSFTVSWLIRTFCFHSFLLYLTLIYPFEVDKIECIKKMSQENRFKQLFLL